MADRKHAGVADVDLDAQDDDRVDEHLGDQPFAGQSPKRGIEKPTGDEKRKQQGAADRWNGQMTNGVA